jgi:hypothetical protein
MFPHEFIVVFLAHTEAELGQDNNKQDEASED